MQQDLVDRILAIERLTLGYEVIKPVDSVEAIDSAALVKSAMQNMGLKYFQRYVVTDHATGKPTGYVSAARLVVAQDDVRVGDIAEELPTMREDMLLHQAVQNMQKIGCDMALVVDAQGNTKGFAFRNDALRVIATLD